MSNYTQFSPYEVALAQSVNGNFNIVKQGLSNTCANDGIDTATMSGKINMNNHSITGLPEKLDSSSAVILKQLPNYYTKITNQITTLDFGDYKTLVISSNQTSTLENPIVFTVNIDPNKPNYIYTIITLDIDTIYFQLSNTNTSPAILSAVYPINKNNSKSFIFTNGAFYQYNYSLNRNTTPSNNNIRKIYEFAMTNVKNVSSITIDVSSIGLTSVSDIIGLELNILNITLATPDPASLYFLTFSSANQNNSSYNVFTNGVNAVGLQSLKYSVLNANSNLLGNCLVLDANNSALINNSTYFNFLNNNLNYEGYGINTSTNGLVFNTYGGQTSLPVATNNILTFGVIKKPLVNNNINNYVFNAPSDFENLTQIQYGYRLTYQSTL